MGEEPQVPGDWDPSGSGEPPAQLLRRAISHVESLLHRLEPAVEAADSEAHSAERPVDGPPEPAVADLGGTTPAAAPASPRATEPAVGPPFTPLPTVSGTEKAEALRITLHAHEEAHRLQSEASALRAAAASDGERMLLEARAVSDQVHVEARESATALLEAAHRESRALVEAARAEAASIRQRAIEDHDSRRAEYDALAEQERAAALDEAIVIIDQAEREAEHIRAQAREAGRAEAARVAHEQVSLAVGDVRRTMHTLLDQVRESLATFDDSVRRIEPERAEIKEATGPRGPSGVPAMPSVPAPTAMQETVEPEQDHDRTPHADEPVRRPLGLLFGAQRG